MIALSFALSLYLQYTLSAESPITGSDVPTGQLYKNDYYGFTFLYPDGWKKTEESSRDNFFSVSFEPRNKKKEERIRISISVSKDMYAEIMKAGSLMEFSKKFPCKERNECKISNATFEEVNINGKEGIKTEYLVDLLPEPPPLFPRIGTQKVVIYRFIKGNAVYISMFMGNEKLYNSMKEDISQSLSSFAIE